MTYDVHFERAILVGRVSPLRAVIPLAIFGAHGVTRPTFRYIRWHNH